jgi:hypothetical protein
MLIVLNRFINAGGTVWLPTWDPVQTLDTEGFKSNLLPLTAGGMYDPQRGERLPRRQRTLSYKGTLIESSVDAIQAAYDALALASGTDGELYGTNELGTQTVHIHARMLVDPGQRAPKDIYRYRGWWTLDVSIAFEVQEKAWKGTWHGPIVNPLDTSTGLDLGYTLDDVAEDTTLATSPITLTRTNEGNLPTDEIVLRLTAGSADITAVTVQCGKATWSWTGTLKSANTLIIDTANALIANQTVLTAPASAGATALTVANAAGTGYATGGRIRIVLDDGTVVERAITSLGGTTTVNISPGLPGAAASGREVWAAAYAGFARDATLHTIAPWLLLVPGTSNLTVTLTGGSTDSTLDTSFWSAHG